MLSLTHGNTVEALEDKIKMVFYTMGIDFGQLAADVTTRSHASALANETDTAYRLPPTTWLLKTGSPALVIKVEYSKSLRQLRHDTAW